MDPSKQRILVAATELLARHQASAITVAAVAKRAGCAKGLVAYHFGSKRALLAAAASAVDERRRQAWAKALARQPAEAAIEATWQLAQRETAGGETRFTPDVATAVGQGVVAVLERAGRVPAIARDELAALGGVTLLGLGPALAAGADARVLEAAHAAFWAAAFSLTRPAP